MLVGGGLRPYHSKSRPEGRPLQRQRYLTQGLQVQTLKPWKGHGMPCPYKDLGWFAMENGIGGAEWHTCVKSSRGESWP
jgi:hypothetical protein